MYRYSDSTAPIIDRKRTRAAIKFFADRNLTDLAAHPYAELPSVVERCNTTGYAPTPQAKAQALYDLLGEAIEALKPTGSVDRLHKTWRAYMLVTEQYLNRRSRDDVSKQLCIDVDTCNHSMAEAVDRLGHWLLSKNSPDAEPAQQAPAATPGYLHNAPPRSQQRLFGRSALLAEIKMYLFDGQDVALFGLPGVGKSSLLNAIAHDSDVLTHFVDGVLWAGLGQTADAFTLLGEWAMRLGLPRAELAYLDTLDKRMTAVHAAIGARKLLLVVDDAWSSETALALRLGGPGCAHVFSSRAQAVAQDCAGRNALPVPELSEADGLALLSDLAPQAVQAFAAETRTLAARVGGLPLALRLMGGYLQRASLSGATGRRVQQALGWLAEAEARLSLTQAGAPLAHSTASNLTLAEVIGLSENVLDEAARRALPALSVFPPKPNTFDETAALAVCVEEPAALDALVDAGLLEADVAGRYMVHPVICDYLVVTHPQEDHTKNKFADFFAHFLTQHHKVHALLDGEYANFNTALTVGLNSVNSFVFVALVNTVFDYYESRGLYGDAQHLLQQAIDVSGAMQDQRHVAEAQLNLGRLAVKCADFSGAREQFVTGLDIATQIEDQKLIAVLLKHLGSLEKDTGNYDRALEHYDHASALSGQLNSQNEICSIELLMGEMAEQLGDYPRAELHYENGLRIARQENDLLNLSALLVNTAMLEAKRNHRIKAIVLLRQGLGMARKVGHKEMICLAQVTQGLGLATLRFFKLAERQIRDALGIARQINHERLKIMAITTYGILETLRENYPVAEAHYDEAITLARRIQHPYDLCFVLNAQGSHSLLFEGAMGRGNSSSGRVHVIGFRL